MFIIAAKMKLIAETETEQIHKNAEQSVLGIFREFWKPAPLTATFKCPQLYCRGNSPQVSSPSRQIETSGTLHSTTEICCACAAERPQHAERQREALRSRPTRHEATALAQDE